MVGIGSGTKAACPARLQMPRWKLEGAKARLSEVVRRTKETGLQLVNQRGQDAVVVIAASEFATLSGRVVPFVDFMAGLSLGGVAIDRDAYAGHDVVL
jgi:prevent-host-death family protein